MQSIIQIIILGCLTIAAAAEDDVPPWVIAGIAAVKTGSLYQEGCLILYHDRRDGADGEVGPWQLSRAVLQDMRSLQVRDRARTDAAFSERLARTWLLRCFRRSGRDWDAAVAMYHTGPKGDHGRGRRYAERVRATGMTNMSTNRRAL